MKTIAIIGIGALGTRTASLLSQHDVNLLLFDGDFVEEKNLARQTLFTKEDIGKSKALQAQRILKNKKIKVHPFFLTKETLRELQCDLVLDCTDNLETRFLINKYAYATKTPWIYSSAFEAQGCTFTIVPGKTPCFHCIFHGKGNMEQCNMIDADIAYKIASFQVGEALRILQGKPYTQKLVYHTKEEEIPIDVKKNPYCPICKKTIIF